MHIGLCSLNTTARRGFSCFNLCGSHDDAGSDDGDDGRDDYDVDDLMGVSSRGYIHNERLIQAGKTRRAWRSQVVPPGEAET